MWFSNTVLFLYVLAFKSVQTEGAKLFQFCKPKIYILFANFNKKKLEISKDAIDGKMKNQGLRFQKILGSTLYLIGIIDNNFNKWKKPKYEYLLKMWIQ